MEGAGAKKQSRGGKKNRRKLFQRGKRETVEIENIGLFALRALSRSRTRRIQFPGCASSTRRKTNVPRRPTWSRDNGVPSQKSSKSVEISIREAAGEASKNRVGFRREAGVGPGRKVDGVWIWNKRTAVTISGFQYWRVPSARYPMCKLSPCILISRCSICRRLRRRCRWRGRWRERGRRCRRCQQYPRKVCNNSLIPDDERLCGGLLPLLPFTPFQPSALQSSRVFDLELSKMHW